MEEEALDLSVKEYIMVVTCQGPQERYAHCYTLIFKPKLQSLAVFSTDNEKISWFPSVPKGQLHAEKFDKYATLDNAHHVEIFKVVKKEVSQEEAEDVRR